VTHQKDIPIVFLPKSLVKVLVLVMINLAMPELLLEDVCTFLLVHNARHLDTLFFFWLVWMVRSNDEFMTKEKITKGKKKEESWEEVGHTMSFSII
jgi:hypothetical protein